MHATRTATLSVMLAVLAGAVPAQRTWIVDALGRPGFHTHTIQQGVDVAAVGDAVVVRSYDGYHGATINKGITLLGETEIVLVSDLVITGVPAGQRVTVKRFRLYDGSSNPYGPRSVRCSGCAGTVHFEQVRGGGSIHGPALDVRDCAHVSALDCTFDAAASYLVVIPNTAFAGADVGVRVERSALALVRCSARGFASLGPVNRRVFHGSWSGLTAHGARVVLTGSTVSGGPGACLAAGTFCMGFGAPTPGLVARAGSTLTLRNTLISGGEYTLGDCNTCGTAAPAMDADGTTSFVPAVAHVFTSGVRPGARLQVTLDASVQAPFVTFLSWPAPVVPIGVGLWLDPAQALTLAFGVVGPGVRQDELDVPSFLPIGLAVGLQAVLLVGPDLQLSTPAVAILH